VLPKILIAVGGAVRDDLEEPHGSKWKAVIANAAKIRAALVGPVNWYDEDPRKYL
jgi:hypothetical protein